MIRVLHVFPQMNNAGTEKVIMNLYNNINRKKIQFDFLVNKKGDIDNEIKELGGRIYYLTAKSKKQYYKKLLEFFENHNYNIIHTHTHANMGLVLKAAKTKNVKCRIAHSHNARTDLPKITVLYKILKSRNIEKCATDFFACSEIAAKWLFPSKYKKSKLIYNGIDLEKFRYNSLNRAKIRTELNINQNMKVITSVARFSKEKNHKKIVGVAKKLLKKNKNIKFVLVGIGPLQEKIKNKIKKYNLQNYFIFLNNRNDVNNILMASDLFLFPSIHEGLGISLIEAQVSGLKCIVSKSIPKEADIGVNMVNFLSLKKSNENWSNEILESLKLKLNRTKVYDTSLNSNYNIQKEVEKLEKFYCLRESGI